MLEEKETIIQNYSDDFVNNLLGNIDLSKVSKDGTGDFDKIPDGYYLCELTEGKYESAIETKKAPRIKLVFTIVENGLKTIVDENGDLSYEEAEHTENRKLFVFFNLTSEQNVKKFARDMLKFEDLSMEGEHISLLTMECFSSIDLISASLETLIGSRIYIHVSTTTKNGENSTWNNLITWERAEALKLPL